MDIIREIAQSLWVESKRENLDRGDISLMLYS